ncbi:MAG TPA: GNAT family N-acetyltransferase [Candidatus Elarobacter sp.]|nr:GNAT family N-acetyltransferase [Candidatus Elarobacter sp.]
MLEGGHGPGVPDDLVLSRAAGGAVDGLAHFGAQLVLAADGEEVVAALAAELRKHRAPRSFVGPKPAVDALWERLRDRHPRPSIVRAAQPVYALTPPELRFAGGDVEVRRARDEDAPVIAEHSARMILGELGYDPRANRPAFTAAVRRAIALGLWWVWIVDGRLRFQLNVGPRTRATAQLQGVWTPPEQRGNGYATRALAGIARRLFATEASLSLYVNDFNRPAIALYERLGFSRVGTFSTLLFP